MSPIDTVSPLSSNLFLVNLHDFQVAKQNADRLPSSLVDGWGIYYEEFRNCSWSNHYHIGILPLNNNHSAGPVLVVDYNGNVVGGALITVYMLIVAGNSTYEAMESA